jgi:hypothetical protein
MSRSNYRKIINFGDITPKNPLEVCFGNTINNKFEGGVIGDVIGGQHSENCQMLMSDYCSNNWDGYCELASHNVATKYPNMVPGCALPVPGCGDYCRRLTAGENLIRNAAFKRFTRSPNCSQRCQPFNPTDPRSPQICYNIAIPCFGVSDCEIVCEIGDISNLNRDPLFLKMLENPRATMDILVGLYQCAKKQGKLDQIMNTNFGKFISINPSNFQ